MGFRTPEPPLPETFIRRYPMDNYESVAINLGGQALESARLTKRQFGLAVPTVARIDAGAHAFSVLDTRRSDHYGSPLLIVDNSFAKDKSRGYRGIWGSDPVMIGRDYNTERFTYNTSVSYEHFSVALDGLDLVVRNFHPANTTYLSGDIPAAKLAQQKPRNLWAGYTQALWEDVRDGNDYGTGDTHAPRGYFKGHAIIGRESPTVRGGVYFTTSPMSEAVIVDDQSQALKLAIEEMAVYLQYGYRKTSVATTEGKLQAVKAYTRKLMPYRLRIAERLSSPHYTDNGLINLSEYLEAGGGVCRHQNLFAALMIEGLMEKEFLDGKVWVERNNDIDAHGAHAWTIFQDSSQEETVVDPAQNYVGARQKGRWQYYLPVIE